MNVSSGHMAIFLLTTMAAGALAGQKTDQAAPPQQQQQQQQQQGDRPTLGPRTGPGLSAGPDTSTTTDFRKLVRIRSIYIEEIDNSLSEKLIDTIGTWGRFHLVTKAQDADATVRGSCLESRRLKHVHSEIFISDRTGASIWQDSIYRPFNPPTLDQAVSDTATLVKAHLEQSLKEAERR